MLAHLRSFLVVGQNTKFKTQNPIFQFFPTTGVPRQNTVQNQKIHITEIVQFCVLYLLFAAD